MRIIALRSLSRLERLEMVDVPDPGTTGPGRIRVRLYARSLDLKLERMRKLDVDEAINWQREDWSRFAR